MKKLFIIPCLIAIFVLFSGTANATLLGLNLGLPDILSDSTGIYGYNSYTDTITFGATALTVTFDGTIPIFIDSGKYFAQFNVDNLGNYSGSIPGNDMEIYGNIDIDGDGVDEYSGLLISGNITNFGFLNVPGPYAYFDYTFDVTGGSLAPFYNNGTGGDVVSSECSSFNGNWNVSHGGLKVKHDTAPTSTPTPGTLVLLSMGLMCLGTVRGIKPSYNKNM